ncbi:MAG TPA: hypothetical protein VGY57_13600 [Vicinamibacterales bacterium]|nr:hypothetical protein [Vicinamibacterales bacterium]
MPPRSRPAAKRRIVERLERAKTEAAHFGLTPWVFAARLALADETEGGARRPADFAGIETDATRAGFGRASP